MNVERNVVTLHPASQPASTPEQRRAQLRVVSSQPQEPARAETPSTGRRWITVPRLCAVLVTALLVWGYRFPLQQYITPQTGLGYLLGIVGGSAMLLLLLYPVRKRLPQFSALGSTKLWFEIHTALGIIGPVLILFHANFRTGATNSNVALYSMLIVAGSGLFGRYFYNRIHIGLDGRKTSLAELHRNADRLRQSGKETAFLPELVNHIDDAEQGMIRTCETSFLLARPFAAAAAALTARWRLRRYVRQSLRAATAREQMSPAQAARFAEIADRYVSARIAAARSVAEFAAFDRMFSLWHALHMPLFILLLIAGIVHVVSVHVY
jgi:hypothetical protein